MLSLTLTSLSGPVGGLFAVYYPFGTQIPVINTADGLSYVDTLDVNASGHEHYAMVFTAAGVYDLELTAYGTLADSGETLAARAAFRFLVGVPSPAAVPEPTSSATAAVSAASLMGVAALRRRSAVRHLKKAREGGSVTACFARSSTDHR